MRVWPWLLSIALVAGGYAFYHRAALHGQYWKPANLAEAAPCQSIPAAQWSEWIGTPQVAVRTHTPAADVPVAGACRVEFPQGSLLVLWFNQDALRSHGQAMSVTDYFHTMVVGLEYVLKQPPAPVAGLGEEAVQAGFPATPDAPAQLLARRGDHIVQLVASGLDAARTEAIARQLLARLP